MEASLCPFGIEPDMSADRSRMEAVSTFAGQYREQYLSESRIDPRQETDPLRLRFLFEKIFASARSGAVSARYREAAERVLSDHQAAVRERWNSTTNGITDAELKTALETEGLTNGRDRRMVVDVVDELGRIPEYDHDIVRYARDRIEAGAVGEAFETLDGVYNVGPKKASLFLRDVTSFWGLEESIEEDQYRYVMPIDTRVHQVADALGIVGTEEPDWRSNADAIVTECNGHVSPISFNQGAWYVAVNAFGILIENLPRFRPE